MKPETTRSFGGLLTLEKIREAIKEKYPKASELEMCIRTKLESRFQNKHLRAYLRGQKRFSYGFDAQGRPHYFNVLDGSYEDEGPPKMISDLLINETKKENSE